MYTISIYIVSIKVKSYEWMKKRILVDKIKTDKLELINKFLISKFDNIQITIENYSNKRPNKINRMKIIVEIKYDNNSRDYFYFYDIRQYFYFCEGFNFVLRLMEYVTKE